jgi:hypothetical protein
MVAVMFGAAGGKAGAGLTNMLFDEDSVAGDGTSAFFGAGRGPAGGAARAPRGVINIANESRHAPNTLLLLGVVEIERYMATP